MNTVPTVTISPLASLKRFAVAFVGRAIDELRSQDPVDALEAALWLTGDDFPMWAECCGMPFADGFKLLTTGAARRYKRSFIDGQARRQERQKESIHVKQCDGPVSGLDRGAGEAIARADHADIVPTASADREPEAGKDAHHLPHIEGEKGEQP